MSAEQEPINNTQAHMPPTTTTFDLSSLQQEVMSIRDQLQEQGLAFQEASDSALSSVMQNLGLSSGDHHPQGLTWEEMEELIRQLGIPDEKVFVHTNDQLIDAICEAFHARGDVESLRIAQEYAGERGISNLVFG
jgi:hypothetical protein